jgi:hypothetical protein
MEKSFGLFFFIKKSKSIKAVEHFIYLHITVDGVGCDISIKRKCDPAKWNGDAGRAEGKTEAVKSLNSYLDLLQRKVYEARQQLIHHGHPVTAENVKTVFYGKEVKTHKYMLMEVFKRHNSAASSSSSSLSKLTPFTLISRRYFLTVLREVLTALAMVCNATPLLRSLIICFNILIVIVFPAILCS